jgi:hypothetical protein
MMDEYSTQAEFFWERLAPEMPPNVLKRIANEFGAHRRVTASLRKIELARAVNARCGWDGKTTGFCLTAFGRIVFADPKEEAKWKRMYEKHAPQ